MKNRRDLIEWQDQRGQDCKKPKARCNLSSSPTRHKELITPLLYAKNDVLHKDSQAYQSQGSDDIESFAKI